MKTIIFDLEGTLVSLKPTLACFADAETLKELSKTYAFALVSGGSRRQVMHALEQTNLRKFFDDEFIITFDDTNAEKSTGLPFYAIKKRLQGSMVMIGDSDGDDLGTKITGIPFVRVKACTTMKDQRNELERAIDKAVDILGKQ